MIETYKSLKSLMGQNTEARLNYLDEETRKLGIMPRSYEIESSRGRDRHLVIPFDYGRAHDLWLTANYDTFDTLPGANNNGSGVITLLKLSEHLRKAQLPVNVRLVYFDAGLDPDLVTKKRRNPDFIPGSSLFMQHLITSETEFIDTYDGTITLQGVGKGNLCVFQTTGKRIENTARLNQLITQHGQSIRVPVEVREHSPNADNMAFLEEGLDAAVLARYHEGSWHRMQTKDDDLANVNPRAIDETVMFLRTLTGSYQAK
jgi:hypothetical protein